MNKNLFKLYILRIIPHKFIRFTLKYLNVNYLLFGNSKKAVGTYIINDEKSYFSSFDESLDKEVLSGFEKCCDDYLQRNNLLREYILQCEDCVIEPKHGWGIINSSNELIFDSISNNAWIESYPPSFVKYIISKSNATYYPELISIRMLGGGEKNYWHFFSDLLGQIVLAQKFNLDHIPFLISKRLYDQAYYKQAVARSKYLQGLTWIVQDEQYIKTDTAYFMQKELNAVEQFLGIRVMLEVPNSDSKKRRKVFLTRNKNRIRHINNSFEIEEIAISYGFEIIDADTLNLNMQIELFGEIEFLIGIHGAGLTNIMFRKLAPMRLLEIFPKDYLQPHYYWLSKGIGHSYCCLMGSNTLKDTSFILNAEEFEKKLIRFIH